MTVEVVGKRVGYVGALRHYAHSVWNVLHNRTHEQRIVGATEDDGVDERILAHQLVDALLHEVVGAGRVCFAGFYYRCPKRAGNARNLNIGEEFLNLYLVRIALDCAFCGEYAHMTCLC